MSRRELGVGEILVRPRVGARLELRIRAERGLAYQALADYPAAGGTTARHVCDQSEGLEGRESVVERTVGEVGRLRRWGAT